VIVVRLLDSYLPPEIGRLHAQQLNLDQQRPQPALQQKWLRLLRLSDV
jgi:hypothetical protein